jgi:hypothetical protein
MASKSARFLALPSGMASLAKFSIGAVLALALLLLLSGKAQAQLGEGAAQDVPLSAQFVVGEMHADLVKAAARARGAVWDAWLGSGARTIRVEFRPKDQRALILDFHVVPYGQVHLTCAMPCSNWKLKQEQATALERRVTLRDNPIGEKERLEPSSYRIVFLDKDGHIVFWL